jgi:large subunit ribosomal protein L22
LEAKAVEKYIRMSSTKVKYVIDLVKNKPVIEAMDILTFTTRGAAAPVKKAIQSASANAVENFKDYKVAEDDLFVKEIYVNEGPTLKRSKARARGRGTKILKRTSHITVLVSDGKEKQEVKSAKKKEAKN